MLPVMFMDRDDPNPGMPWASRLEVAELIELARRKRIEHCLANPRKPGQDRWLGPVPATDRDPQKTRLHNLRWPFFPCSRGGMPLSKRDGAMDAWGKTVLALAFANERVYILQRDDVPSKPRGKRRRRERGRLCAQELARDLMRRAGYTASDAPGVDPEIRYPTDLMGVKSTNSPDRVELPPTPPKSRRRDRRSYSPNTSSSDEAPPQSTRELDLEAPADPPDGDSLEPVCNLAVLTKSRRKVVANGLNQLGDHDKALRTLFFPEQCCVTCGPKHFVAITSHPSAFQDPMIHCLNIGEAGSGQWEASLVRSTLQESSPSLIIIAVSHTVHGMMV